VYTELVVVDIDMCLCIVLVVKTIYFAHTLK